MVDSKQSKQSSRVLPRQREVPKVRSWLKSSIVYLFTLAIFCFLMIFLLGTAMKHSSDNAVTKNAPIKQQEVNTWGKIPGDLGFSFNKKVTFYTFQYFPTEGATTVNFVSQDPVSFEISRNMTDAAWLPQKSVVNYTLDYEYTQVVESVQNEEAAPVPGSVQYLNLGAQNVWYQMQTRPRFILAWQALAKISNYFYTENYLNKFYAYNALEYFFNDYAAVQNYVLRGLTPQQQQVVYNDPEFGMSQTDTLSKWFAAQIGGTSSDEYAAILAYFNNKGIDLSTYMPNIVGQGSMIFQLSIVNQRLIFTNPDLVICRPAKASNECVTPGAWGSNALMNNTYNYIHGTPLLNSIVDLEPVLGYPYEFGYFLTQQPEITNYDALLIDAEMATTLLKREFSKTDTLLTQQNMRSFYTHYEQRDYNTIYSQFGFNNTAQVDYFKSYLESMIDNVLFMGENIDMANMGYLTYKALNYSYGYIEKSLPVALTTRVSSSMISGDPTTLTCEYYVDQVLADPTASATACGDLDLTNPDDMAIFVNATWFKFDYMDYQTALTEKTGLSTAQQTQLFSTSTETTLGSLIQSATSSISTQYGCNSPTNCTSYELATIQWGNAGVTREPDTTNWPNYQQYTPVQNTLSGWGSWAPYASMTQMPEYLNIDNGGVAMNTQTARKIATDSLNYYGLLNRINTGRLSVAINSANLTAEAEWQDWFGTNLTVKTFYDSYRNYTQRILFLGSYGYYSQEELLFGYETPVASIINGGDYFAGDEFAFSNYSTPIFNDKLGPQVGATYGMLTGALNIDDTANLRIINGQSYINKNLPIWNGTDNIFVQQNPHDVDNQTMDALSGTSTGMQHAPEISHQDTLKVYDPRIMKAVSYTHSEDSKLDKGLEIDMMTSQSFGDNVGFAFNLPVHEKSLGCYGCELFVSDPRQMYIDGEPLIPADKPSDNYIKVQPQSGYTYAIKKDSSYFFIPGGHEDYIKYDYSALPIANPFPALDPIYGLPIPFYDLEENLQANTDLFQSKFEYVSKDGSHLRATTITMSVFAGVFLILCIVAITLYKIKGDGQQRSRDDLLSRESRNSSIQGDIRD